jgi:hypothetical protein
MANTSPQDLPNTQNTSTELRGTIAKSGDEKNVKNHQDSDIMLASSSHLHHPMHNSDSSRSNAISPQKHLQNTPPELPATATNVGVASVHTNIAGAEAKGTGGVPPPTPPPPPSPTKLPPPTSSEATNDTNLPSMMKKKKKRSNKSLSRHGRGRKAKAIKSDAPKNVFPATRDLSSSPPPDPTSHGYVNPPPLARQIKSLRNKKDYEKRKSQRAEQAVEQLKDELSIAKSHISDLELTNKHDSFQISQLKDSADKSALLLATRTDRFVAYRARKEEEIRKLKATAEKKIAALEKQYKFVLVREKAERYKMERAHSKALVTKTMEISGAQRAKE